ncbi:MAG: HAMP domain-containing protein [Fibrobacteres bacterium]|jgi:NtrC-family two-component system sensor histidine kinase KinB|nr:HAMP domain-containing protein [Fibrobacterota bacterium]
MTGFRLKLFAGFGAVLTILLAIGILALKLLGDYSGTLDRIFRENYDSVRYGQEMKESVEEMDRAVRLVSFGDTTATVEAARARFVRNLRLEQGNITVPGEARVVRRLDSLWRCYDSLVGLALAKTDDRTAKPRLEEIAQASRSLSQAAQAVIDVNVDNIFSVDGQVKRSASQARRTLILLLAGGVVLALVLSSMASAWVTVPVRTLTDSVREVGKGNLDLVVAIPSRDELGELAEAFNAMAAKLREFRHSDRQRMWRIHRTTQNAIDSLPDAVAVVAPDGKVEMGNGAARRVFGLEAGSRLEERGEGRLTTFFAKAVQTREAVQPRSFDAAIQAFDEGERFYLPRAIPILEPDGTVAGVTLVLADITQLRRLDEMKSGMLSVVAHELRTPLTSLRMSSHLLMDERLGELSAKQEELAAGLREDADRLWQIVEELLDIGRMDAGRSLMEMAPQDAREIVRHAVAEREGSFREKGVRLVLESPMDLPSVRADASRLGLVVGNLLSNALRHTPAGKDVRVRLAVEGDAITICVIDEGEGIAEEHLPRLFERFYRVPGQSNKSGVGLGLSIVREIVQAHEGTVTATSRSGHGARFSIRLPLNRAKDAPTIQESHHA